MTALDADGFDTLPGVLAADALDDLAAAVEPHLSALSGAKGGVRDALAIPAVRMAAAGPLRVLAVQVLGAGCVAVNATLFDKTAGRNWKVQFHQDVTIRVRERRAVPGIETWWEKAGVPHCWPTAEVLEGMIALRLHLDDCGPANGPLRVLPGSHRAGVLESAAIDAWPRDKETACLAGRGGVVRMRPLLLHASSAAEAPARRRVLHVEYAGAELPGGLRWWDAVPASGQA